MNKQLVALLVLLAAVGAAIYYLMIQANQQTDSQAPLFPELTEYAQRIDGIQVVNASGVVFDAKRSRSGWSTRVDTIGRDYPLQQKRLAELVEGLSKASLFEAKTARSENYDKLGLTDIAQADSQATRVVVTAAGKTFDLLVGDDASSGQGSYVRLTGKKQSWLIDQSLVLPAGKTDWLQQPILDFSSEQVMSVEKLGEPGFTITRQAGEDNRFAIAALSEQPLKYDGIVSNFVDSFITANFDGFAAVDDEFWQQNPSVTRFDMLLENGDLIEVFLGQQDEQHFIKFARVAPAEEAYWDGVSYQISSFVAGQLDKSLVDFIDTAPPPTANPQTPAIDEGESPSG